MNQRRESSSIDFAHESGKMDVKNFCIQFMASQLRLPVRGEASAAHTGNTIRGRREDVPDNPAWVHLDPEL